MKTRRIRLSLACAACALLMVPAAAQAAKPGFEVKPKRLTLQLDLGTSNGYAVEIDTRGDMVTLSLAEGRPTILSGTTVTYRTRGTVSLRRIEADFGSFGRISARFSGRTLVGDLSKRCKGRKSVIASGSYRGSFQFKGEDGYVEVATDRAAGLGTQRFRRVCRQRGSRSQGSTASAARPRPTEPERAAVLFNVRSKTAEREINFAQVGVESIDSRGKRRIESEVLVGTKIEERHENVAIERSTLDFGAGAFIVSPPDAHPVSITVAPPSPYTGTAAFLQEVGSASSWTGDLAVSLPGAPATPLTGPDFKTTFCRILDEPGLEACAAKIEGASASAQLSGSQSQALGETRLSWLR